MKYNGFYYRMFESSMKKVLVEKYGKQYANEIMRKSKKTYRELVEKADDIGDGLAQKLHITAQHDAAPRRNAPGGLLQGRLLRLRVPKCKFKIYHTSHFFLSVS